MYQRILFKLFRFWLSIKTVKPSSKLIRLGTEGCGWFIPEKNISKGNIAICAGAGEDVSFDIALNAAGLDVYVLDPTPRAKQHIQNIINAFEKGRSFPINNASEYYDLSKFDIARFHFHDVGLAAENGRLKFYAPADPEHVSHSIRNIQQTDTYFEASCQSYDNYLSTHNIAKVDIVKLDIEGAEYEVIDSILDSKTKPKLLAVDFDELNITISWKILKRIRHYILKLEKSQYRLISTNHSDFVFEKRPDQ